MCRTAWVALAALAVLASAGPSAHGQAARQKSVNNLKLLALAMINYADANGGQMPMPAVYDKDGKPLLSWRVQILPYLEQENLYKQFKLDQPWDSEHNKKLLEKMPAVFAPVKGATKEKYATYYQVLVGGGAAFEPKASLRFPAAFTDGTSNTILIVEAGEAVPWTKPADLVYDPAKPLPKFGGLFEGDFNAAYADGSVHFIGKKADETTLRATITRAGGEVYDPDKLK